MHWSLDGGILAVATITEVKLFCAMRLNDLIDGTPWSCFASVTIDSLVTFLDLFSADTDHDL